MPPIAIVPYYNVRNRREISRLGNTVISQPGAAIAVGAELPRASLWRSHCFYRAGKKDNINYGAAVVVLAAMTVVAVAVTIVVFPAGAAGVVLAGMAVVAVVATIVVFPAGDVVATPAGVVTAAAGVVFAVPPLVTGAAATPVTMSTDSATDP